MLFFQHKIQYPWFKFMIFRVFANAISIHRVHSVFIFHILILTLSNFLLLGIFEHCSTIINLFALKTLKLIIIFQIHAILLIFKSN